MKCIGLAVAAIGLILLPACQERHISSSPVAYVPQKTEPLDSELNNEARNELSTDLQSQDPEIRSHAIEAVSIAGGANHDAQIIEALKDRAPMVRYTAALAVGNLRLSAAHEALLAIADDPDERVRVAVRYALHRIGDTHLSHQLEKMSQDTDPAVRGTTAMVLGLLGEPSALKILHPMRYDHNEAVRQQAAEAMWRLHDEEGLTDLVALSMSKRSDDEMMGLLGLAAPRDTRVRQHVRVGLRADWLEVSLVAARAMGMLGSDEGFGIALQGAKDADYRKRFLAAWAFGDIGRLDGQDSLRKLLHDTEPNVRIAAAASILELKSQGFASRAGG